MHVDTTAEPLQVEDAEPCFLPFRVGAASFSSTRPSHFLCSSGSLCNVCSSCLRPLSVWNGNGSSRIRAQQVLHSAPPSRRRTHLPPNTRWHHRQISAGMLITALKATFIEPKITPVGHHVVKRSKMTNKKLVATQCESGLSTPLLKYASPSPPTLLAGQRACEVNHSKISYQIKATAYTVLG